MRIAIASIQHCAAQAGDNAMMVAKHTHVKLDV